MRKPRINFLYNLVKVINNTLNETQLVKPSKISKERKIYTRREFISTTSKATLAISLSSAIPELFGCSRENILPVAIIGGGIAGLNCANHLINSGLDFKIFEANKRVGGRILTHYNETLGAGQFPEFGADFIDSNHVDMISLAKEFNLDLIDLVSFQQSNKLKKDTYFFKNTLIEESEIIKEFTSISHKIKSDIESLGENYDTPSALQLDNTPLDNYINQLNCSRWFKDFLIAAFTAEFGLDCSEQSTLNMLDMINPQTDEGFQVYGESDERYRVKGGNSKITESLAKKIGIDNIHLNHKLISISDETDNTYRLTFENGRTVRAKVVVMTLPFTVLRNIEMNLREMNEEKKHCIETLGYGMNTKLLLSFEGSPWRSEPNNAAGYLFTNNIVSGWDGGFNKTENSKLGVYVCYFGGKFSEGLNKISLKSKKAPQSHSWRTALPDEKVLEILNDLDLIFPGTKSKFSGNHVFANWIDFPYVMASYSCYKPGQWTTISGKEFEPVGNVYFAGEHCSEMFQGFMNGAAETGRLVANMILNHRRD